MKTKDRDELNEQWEDYYYPNEPKLKRSILIPNGQIGEQLVRKQYELIKNLLVEC
jgi:hypothetical protein